MIEGIRILCKYKNENQPSYYLLHFQPKLAYLCHLPQKIPEVRLSPDDLFEELWAVYAAKKECPPARRAPRPPLKPV
jgi:hypothetical protein